MTCAVVTRADLTEGVNGTPARLSQDNLDNKQGENSTWT